MGTAREKAKIYLARVPSTGWLSSRDHQEKFDGLVGQAPRRPTDRKLPRESGYDTRQDQMAASGWQMTFCNEFAGECARFCTNVYMGALNLEDWILKGNKPYAWIDADSGKQPQFGDIFYVLSPHRHLGVSRGVKDGVHLKVEAGQGGIHYKEDRLAYTQSQWNPAEYAGWVDIDLFVDGPAADTVTPNSPIGKWTVWGDRRRYRWNYTFVEKNNRVTWVDVFNGMSGGGTWLYEGDYLQINWDSGSKDFWKLPVNPAGMKGWEHMKGEGEISIEASKQ